MKEQCPHCHNTVAGQFAPSETRKWLTGLAKKGGMKAVLTAAGSVIPGFGNVSGFIAGTALDVIYGKDINKLIDKIADEFDDNKIYVFECPNCGHTWTHSAQKNGDLASYLTPDDIFDKVEQILVERLGVDEDEVYLEAELMTDLGADSLDAVEIIMDIEKEFDVDIPDADAKKVRTVEDIVSYIQNRLGIEDEDEDIYDDDEDDEEGDDYEEKLNQPFRMPIDDIFDITGRGTVATGCIEAGVVNVGDKVYICGGGIEHEAIVTGIEMFRKLLDRAEYGDNCGLLLRGVSKNDISKGMIISQTQNVAKCQSAKTANSLSDKIMISEVESEYIDEVKACLEEGGEISKGERRLLEKLRIKLGITEERAAELEQSLIDPQLTEDEQEYLAEYRECLADGGEISAGERRLLNRLRDKLGISEERASELEQIA